MTINLTSYSAPNPANEKYPTHIILSESEFANLDLAISLLELLKSNRATFQANIFIPCNDEQANLVKNILGNVAVSYTER